MDPLTIGFVSLIGLVLLSIPAMLVIGLRRQGQRSCDLQAFAAGHGFSYDKRAKLPDEVCSLLVRTRTIPEGWKIEHVRNVMKRRQAGAELLVFDCQYTKTGQVTASTIRLFSTVACVRTNESQPWGFVLEAKTGGARYLGVEGMAEFVNHAAAKFAGAAVP